MTINRANAVAIPGRALLSWVKSTFDWLERVPYALLALPLRLAVATVFWNSAMAHLANWETTLELFDTDYRLPILPPMLAAYMAIAIELSAPVLLVIGLFTRPTALVLLGMTTVIEVFVYPQAWPTHIQWAAMMLVLLCRGAGAFSADEVLKRFLLLRFEPRNRP